MPAHRLLTITVALALLVPSGQLDAQLAGQWLPRSAGPGLYTADATLGQLVERLAEASPTFAAMLESIHTGRLPVFLGTLEQGQERVPGTPRQPGDSPAFARLILQNRDGDTTYVSAVVLIDVSVVRRWHERAGVLGQAELDEDLMILIAHEFVHVASIAETRQRNAACRDPDWKELVKELAGGSSASCVVEAENRIRAELGLRRRPRYLDPALHASEVLDVETLLEEMRLARLPRIRPILAVASADPRDD